MTHVVGLTVAGVSYLWADSAVTVPSPDDLSPRRSVFEEVSSVRYEHRVDQGAIKIERCGSALVACAGDAMMALAILAAFRGALSTGSSVEAAFRTAVVSNSPVPAGRETQLCCAFPVGCSSRMITYNQFQDNEIRVLGDGEYLQLGSAPTHVLAYSAAALHALLRGGAHNQPNILLSLVLGALQRNGPAENLMSHGVGGPYCGAYVNGEGPHWQNDILNFLYSSRDPEFVPRHTVITYVRDDVLVAVPGVGRPAAFLPSDSDQAQWADRHWPSSVRHVRSGRVDHISFLDLVDRRVTVVNMEQQLSTSKMQLNVIPAEGGLRVQLGVHPELLVPLKGPMPPSTLKGGFSFALTYVPNDAG